MAQTLVIVNGEEFWHDHFAEDYEVYHVRLQTSKWMLIEDKLFVYDGSKRIRVDSIFWRIGAIQPYQHHREILELIRFSGVPCVNSPMVMLDDFNRWSMLNRLKELDIPIVPFTAVVGSVLANQLKPEIPLVIKVGSYHAGYGKMRITSLEQWQDMTDFVFATDGYFTIEPFIDYKRDIRCLAIGNQIWSLARNGSRWKANSGIVDTHLINAPDILYDYTKRVVEALHTDIIALDILETQDNQYVVLESNSVPGISGFPDAVIEAIVERVHLKISSLD
jgi:ribosomal protein S6--L-glutamate ligase